MGNNRFTDGMLLGALIGGTAVFLLGTKKGKKVLKILTEEGLAGFSEIAKELETGAKKETKNGLVKLEEKIEDLGESIVVEEANGASTEKSPTKRFFKKAK
jgi:gas vesicle protein